MVATGVGLMARWLFDLARSVGIPMVLLEHEVGAQRGESYHCVALSLEVTVRVPVLSEIRITESNPVRVRGILFWGGRRVVLEWVEFWQMNGMRFTVGDAVDCTYVLFAQGDYR